MVPAATATHFDDVYVYFAIARGERLQFGLASRLPRGGTKFITENIVHQPQILTPTDGTTLRCRVSVISAGTDQYGEASQTSCVSTLPEATSRNNALRCSE